MIRSNKWVRNGTFQGETVIAGAVALTMSTLSDPDLWKLKNWRLAL